MNYRPTLSFICTVLLLLGIAGCAYGMLGLLNTVQAWAIDRQMEKLLAPTPTPYHGRDIRHCFRDDTQLWECIIVAKE